MKRNNIILPICAAIALGVVSCSKKNVSPEEGMPVQQGVQILKPAVLGFGPTRTVLKASAFKMSGDYADNVAVTLNADGSLAYFPDPSDISEASKPVALGNGWYLNRQGISPRSVFTRYTFEEYSKLKQVPTTEELKAAIIPGARVAGWQQLPYTPQEAMSRLEEIKGMLE